LQFQSLKTTRLPVILPSLPKADWHFVRSYLARFPTLNFT
jgi:hypothetical protein